MRTVHALLVAAALAPVGVLSIAPPLPARIGLPPLAARSPADVLHTRSAGERLAIAAKRYRVLSETHYLPMAATQSGLLRGAADGVGQALTHGSVDPVHVGIVATIGFIISGLGGAIWLRHLDSKLGSGTHNTLVLRKTLTDYTCWAPVANSCWLLLVPLLMGSSVEEAATSLHAGFASVMMLEASIFMPYNLLAFSSIPASLRPPCEALLAAVFTIGLGMIASGGA